MSSPWRPETPAGVVMPPGNALTLSGLTLVLVDHLPRHKSVLVGTSKQNLVASATGWGCEAAPGPRIPSLETSESVVFRTRLMFTLDHGRSALLPTCPQVPSPRYVLAADREFRGVHTGASDEYLVPMAREAFEGIGFHLTNSQLEQYALSVAGDRPFEFALD